MSRLNTHRLQSLLRDGKIYLSLSDAVTLALENNYDIAIARINLDIADTDHSADEGGERLRGVSTGLVAEYAWRNDVHDDLRRRRAGRNVGWRGRRCAARRGLVLSTNGGGPLPENLDPILTGTLQYEASNTPQTTTFITGTNTLNQNTATYNFGYQQGFLTGTLFNFTFNNSRSTTNSIRSNYSPQVNSYFQATGDAASAAGIWARA